MTSSLTEKLENQEYRKAFVASQINIGLPFQLRALLKARGKTQEWLAEKTGMLQPRISALLTPGKTKPNIETLRRLAEAFDCGLAVRFVPFSELAGWSERFDPESFTVPEFDYDTGFQETEAPNALAATALHQYGVALSPDSLSQLAWGIESRGKQYRQYGVPEPEKDLGNIPPVSSQLIFDAVRSILKMLPPGSAPKPPSSTTEIHSIRDMQNPSSEVSAQILKTPSVAA